MPAPGYRMKYVDVHGKQQFLSEHSAAILKHVAAADEPVGRREVTNWRISEIRHLQDRGLLEVRWLERADPDREGAWEVQGVTEAGRVVLTAWNTREEER
ncbi:hypothetical protein ABZ543_13380 [Streptomyces roseifaciens]